MRRCGTPRSSSIGPGQALLVLVFEDNQIENRILKTPPGHAAGALAEAANYLNARFKGKTLAEARAAAGEALARDRAALDQAAAKLVRKRAGRNGPAKIRRSGRALIVRGRGNLLQDQQAIADLERARRLFDDLEKTRELIQVLDLAKAGDAVRVFIGSENPLFSLSGSSLIVAPYMNAERRVVGALGVIGPTRLELCPGDPGRGLHRPRRRPGARRTRRERNEDGMTNESNAAAGSAGSAERRRPDVGRARSRTGEGARRDAARAGGSGEHPPPRRAPGRRKRASTPSTASPPTCLPVADTLGRALARRAARRSRRRLPQSADRR